MKKYLIILPVLFGAIAYFYFKNDNHVLSHSSDRFAELVNQFIDRDMGNKILTACIAHDAYPNKIEKSGFYHQMMVDELKKLCPPYLIRLATYLNNVPDFKDVTLLDLQQQSTWLHYFKSKKSRHTH